MTRQKKKKNGIKDHFEILTWRERWRAGPSRTLGNVSQKKKKKTLGKNDDPNTS